jgi:hypothetical protein
MQVFGVATYEEGHFLPQRGRRRVVASHAGVATPGPGLHDVPASGISLDTALRAPTPRKSKPAP